LTRTEALTYAVLLFIGGTAGSIFLNTSALIIACTVVIVLFFYSMKFKRTVLIGNLIVSLVTAFAFIYGAVAAGNILKSFVPALFAFLLIFGREIIKDVEDMEGDMKNHIKTFPIRFGVEKSIILITIVFILLIAVTVLVYLLHIYNTRYLFIVLLGSDSILFYSIYLMWKHRAKAEWGMISTMLRWNMLVGLLAIYVG